VKLNQTDDELKNTVNSMMRHRTAQDETVWASKFMELLAGTILQNKHTELYAALKHLIGDSGMGVAFESLGHRKLITCTDNFFLRPLHRKYQKTNKYEALSLHFNHPIVLFESKEDIRKLPDERYGLQISTKFPLVDYIIQPNIIGNFTVSTSHRRAVDQLEFIRSQLRGPR
jgi:hypothetical protein